MEASHAKMRADQHFALFRRKYSISDAETMDDLASIVSSSSLTQVIFHKYTYHTITVATDEITDTALALSLSHLSQSPSHLSHFHCNTITLSQHLNGQCHSNCTSSVTAIALSPSHLSHCHRHIYHTVPVTAIPLSVSQQLYCHRHIFHTVSVIAIALSVS